MSWQLASFALIALLLVGGFTWYERSRPSSRTVALVAGLAALAVAGRLVLAPVPNVVATTDIALITGYALGGAPGFAVGALAAPVSNLWLGQGPWTPWQMAGWGLCGLLGAGLAWITGRRLGRFGLALWCALAGFAYGALLDLSVMVTYGGEQSLDRYLALSARGIPFNVAHAAGNFAIALAAGPTLVRMISRFHDRLEFTWRPAPALSLMLGLTVVGSVLLPPPAEAAGPAAARGYLERQQNSDGGFGATPTASSNADMTAWAMLGMEASGRNPLDLRANGRSPVDFLRAYGAPSSTSDLEKVILALTGAGVNPRSFEGHDLVADLRRRRSANSSYSGFVDLTAFGMFALRAGGAAASELRRSASWLRSAQNSDGGWGFKDNQPSYPDSTGSALQALALTGGRNSRSRAVSYLRDIQSSDGSFGGNSQSTAWAIQGLVGAGVNPAGVASGGKDGFDYLAARQAGDGHYRYSASSDQTPIWVTSQALMAVERETFPVESVPRTFDPGGLSAPEDGAETGGPGDSSFRSGPGSGTPGGGDGRGGEAKGAGDAGRGAESSGRWGEARDAALAAAALPGEAGSDGGEAGEGGSGDGVRQWALGGLGALAAGLGGGFLWYRRRLP